MSTKRPDESDDKPAAITQSELAAGAIESVQEAARQALNRLDEALQDALEQIEEALRLVREVKTRGAAPKADDPAVAAIGRALEATDAALRQADKANTEPGAGIFKLLSAVSSQLLGVPIAPGDLQKLAKEAQHGAK